MSKQVLKLINGNVRNAEKRIIQLTNLSVVTRCAQAGDVKKTIQLSKNKKKVAKIAFGLLKRMRQIKNYNKIMIKTRNQI